MELIGVNKSPSQEMTVQPAEQSRMDKFKAIEVFARVVDTGSFTKAAEALAMPKATVSTLLQELEAQLGVRLLQRTTRRVGLTADGAAYYERCVRILDDLREADEAVSARHGQPEGRLKVDMPTSLASQLLHEAIPAFLARYPGLQLELGCSDRLINVVNEGVDCVLRVGELRDPLLVARRVGELRLATVAPAPLRELLCDGRQTHALRLQEGRRGLEPDPAWRDCCE
jgi:LysR family transcriptional regulator for bpeEF and oprC